jgi:HAD superfamily phosphoserine phosphatase-like hydrolase
VISVIIPVLNESSTISDLVAFAKRNPQVTEVIVVDDGSIDGTPQIAKAAGAVVVTSTLRGKGASMEDGMFAAHNELLVYLDGDLQGLHPNLIELLVSPLQNNETDFVKAKFSRSAGRVTTLTAKPLLRLFFPELAEIAQPLGGIIAAKRSLLRNLRLETDYGVDIGLLIDIHAKGARISEVDIGSIEHDSHSLSELGDMAMQVVRTLFDRAARYKRFSVRQVQEVEEVERRTQWEISVAIDKLGTIERLALIDMDGTLLRGRFIIQLAKRVNKMTELSNYLDHPKMSAAERTNAIAAVFAQVPLEIFKEVAREMPLMEGAQELVVGLRRAGYRVGIITDSFHVAADIVRRRVFADFSVAHLMRFQRGKATGEITLSPAMLWEHGCQEHSLCKLNVLNYLVHRYQLNRDCVLAIGDGDNDVCMLREAGLGIAFQPKTENVRRAAQLTVDSDLTEILSMLNLRDDEPLENAELQPSR